MTDDPTMLERLAVEIHGDEGLPALLASAAYVLARLGRQPEDGDVLCPVRRTAWLQAFERVDVDRAQKIGAACAGPAGIAMIGAPYDDGADLDQVVANQAASDLAAALSEQPGVRS